MVVLLAVFLSACQQVPDNDAEQKALYSLEARVNEMEKDLQEAEERMLEMEAEAKTEAVAAPVEVTTAPPAEETSPLKVGNIGLGYSRDLVGALLGDPRSVTEWEWLDGSRHEIWNYENGMSVKFFDRYVRSIHVTASGPAMDMGLSVGLPAADAEHALLKRGLYAFAFRDGSGCLGWYESDLDELVILEYNTEGDIFNTGLMNSSRETVRAFTLDSVSSYR